MHFAFPWAFLLLLAIPVVVWASRRGKRQGTIRFSSVANASNSGVSWRMRLRWLLPALRVLVLMLLTIGLARPQQGRDAVREVSQGVAMEMLVDRSGSMGQELIDDGRRVSRLDVVKQVFKEFVQGNQKDLKGRPNDLIGMVAFARYADTVCPLTLSHEALDYFLDSISVVTRRSEDGTAIGDALALGAARLKTAEDQLKQANRSLQLKGGGVDPASGAPASGYTIKSKVIILLTDGQNNAGKRSPLEAARMAREWGIKVYAIGVGGREATMALQTPFGEYKVPAGPGVDEATLKAIAEETGGACWLAESTDKLEAVYREIDRMEKTEIEAIRYLDYLERFPVFVLAALVLLCFEQVLASTVFRRIP